MEDGNLTPPANELTRGKQRGINRNIFIAFRGGEFTPCPPPAD